MVQPVFLFRAPIRVAVETGIRVGRDIFEEFEDKDGTLVSPESPAFACATTGTSAASRDISSHQSE